VRTAAGTIVTDTSLRAVVRALPVKTVRSVPAAFTETGSVDTSTVQRTISRAISSHAVQSGIAVVALAPITGVADSMTIAISGANLGGAIDSSPSELADALSIGTVAVSRASIQTSKLGAVGSSVTSGTIALSLVAHTAI